MIYYCKPLLIVLNPGEAFIAAGDEHKLNIANLYAVVLLELLCAKHDLAVYIGKLGSFARLCKEYVLVWLIHHYGVL